MQYLKYFTKKVKSYGLKKSLNLARKKVFGSRYPKEINVEIMTKCNLKCQHCRVTYHGNIIKNVKPGFITLNEFKKITDRIANLIKHAEQFHFSSIEPLFHKDIFKMMDYVCNINKNISFPLLSNGMLLNKSKITEILKRNIPVVTISLDSHRKEVMESFKTGANFDRVVNNIKLLKKESQGRIYLVAVFVAMKENINEITEYVEFCSGLGIDTIQVNGLMSFLPKFSHHYLYSENGNPTVLNQFKKAHRKAAELGINIEFPSLTTRPVGCGLNSYMFIDGKGDVAPCILLSRNTPMEFLSQTNTSEIVNFGNIFQEEALAIWHKKNYGEFRKKISSSNLPGECIYCADAYGVICSNRKLSL
jgi:MoaA/NifB/PqqE/SkfB family radical SAM enzyme